MEYASNIDTLLKVVGVRTSGNEVLILKKSYSEATLPTEELSPLLRRGKSLPNMAGEIEEAVEADSSEV
jgi:hypothetical protein